MVLLSRIRDSVSLQLRKVKNVMKKVEEVSRLSGVSRRTLQYYDDEGILPAKRSEENYRLYDDEALEKLWEILWYKEMGFNLKEIKEMLSVSKSVRKRYFEQKIKIIGNKIRDLEAQREFIKSMEQYKEVPDINSDRKGGELTYKESIKMMKEWRKDEESNRESQGGYIFEEKSKEKKNYFRSNYFVSSGDCNQSSSYRKFRV